MSDAFTYENLESEIRKVIPDKPIISANRWARGALAVGLLGAAVSLAASVFMRGDWRAWIIVPGFVLEIVGFIVYFYHELRTEIPWLRKAKDEFPAILDADYNGYLTLVTWIRRYPLPEVQMHLDYLCLRQDVMARRMGLVVGAIDRLGILPVAAAIYLQVNDMGWPPQISLFQGVLAFLLLALYVLCHWLSGFKLKLDFYVGLLSSAMTKSIKNP